MSEANVQVARDALDAWNAGDMDRLRDLYDPEAEFALPSDWVDPGPYRGRDAIMEQFSVFRDIFGDDCFFDHVELRAAGDHVYAEVAFHGDTRGLALRTGVMWVYTIRRGVIVRLEFFRTRAEALEAAGLSE
jgi:ketosteroid isomerase-like protein